jgi:hypothetical protein
MLSLSQRAIVSVTLYWLFKKNLGEQELLVTDYRELTAHSPSM